MKTKEKEFEKQEMTEADLQKVSANLKNQLKWVYLFAAVMCVLLVGFNFLQSSHFSRNRGEAVGVFSLQTVPPELNESGEDESVAVSGATAAVGEEGSSSEQNVGGLIDLNTASAKELEQLPGIGPATAAKIVAYRELHGNFETVDDLINVSGIGSAKLEEVRQHVTVK